MSIQDRFTNAVVDEASLDPEKREQHAQNANPNSHKNFFADKRARKLPRSIAMGMTDNAEEGYKVAGSAEENALLMSTDVKATRQVVRRNTILKDMVMEALTNRAQEPTGFQVMFMTFQDWSKMHEEYREAEKVGRQGELPFVPYSVYGQNLIYKPDGTPRIKPIRQLLKGEMGQFLSGPHVGKIICVKENSPDDDGKLRAQVPGNVTFTGIDWGEPGCHVQEPDPIDDVLELVQK